MIEDKTNKCPFLNKEKCMVYNGRRYLHEKYHSECQKNIKDFSQCDRYNEARTKTVDVVSGLPFTIRCGKVEIRLNQSK